jgi:hypothetical protein
MTQAYGSYQFPTFSIIYGLENALGQIKGGDMVGMTAETVMPTPKSFPRGNSISQNPIRSFQTHETLISRRLGFAVSPFGR